MSRADTATEAKPYSENKNQNLTAECAESAEQRNDLLISLLRVLCALRG